MRAEEESCTATKSEKRRVGGRAGMGFCCAFASRWEERDRSVCVRDEAFVASVEPMRVTFDECDVQRRRQDERERLMSMGDFTETDEMKRI